MKKVKTYPGVLRRLCVNTVGFDLKYRRPTAKANKFKNMKFLFLGDIFFFFVVFA